MTVNGRTLGENMEGARVFDADVIRGLDNPVYASGALVVLTGSLAPRGAVLKRSAAEARLLDHVGPAVVFKDHHDLVARIDDPDLVVTPDSVLVLQEAGPIGAPGMPEWGMLPIPKKLLEAGVRDMVRISDARMSGTAFGTVILHVSPECAIGGPLGLVRSGDRIRVSVKERRLDVLVSEADLDRRRSEVPPPPALPARGYARLYAETVLGPELGCDFGFLRQPPGAGIQGPAKADP
jgi:dihydroxyacid dehydratase/phosphogluconate dehydratase